MKVWLVVRQVLSVLTDLLTAGRGAGLWSKGNAPTDPVVGSLDKPKR